MGRLPGKSIRRRVGKKIKEKLKLQFLVFICLMVALFMVILQFYDEIRSWIDGLIIAYGLMAVFLISLASDSTPQLIGADVPILAGIALGFPALLTLVVAIFASGLATILNYHIGLKYGAASFHKSYGPEDYNKLIRRL